jgi:hypothetical protein
VEPAFSRVALLNEVPRDMQTVIEQETLNLAIFHHRATANSEDFSLDQAQAKARLMQPYKILRNAL